MFIFSNYNYILFNKNGLHIIKSKHGPDGDDICNQSDMCAELKPVSLSINFISFKVTAYVLV